MRRPIFFGAVLTAISGALTAQAFVVDADNGPGANFTDLPAAIAAVPDGAILLVRQGTYGPVALNAKGLSILATGPGVVITTQNLPILISNLAANQAVTLRGLTQVGTMSASRCLIRNCNGPVLLDDFTSQTVTSGPASYDHQAQAVIVERCLHVTLRNCHLRAWQSLSSLDSDVVVENSELVGQDAVYVPGSGQATGVGAVINGGTVTFARCRVSGGNGVPWMQAGLSPPSPAIWASNAMIRLCEDGSGVYTAGQVPWAMTPAITGQRSTLVRDPSAVLTGLGGVPVFGVTDIQRPLPSLRTIAAPGGTVTADVTTPIGELVVLAVSLPGPVSTVPGIDGSFRLDPASAAMVALGMPAANAPVTHSIAVPNNPGLVGARFTWQAIASSAAHGMRASNPSTYAH